MINFDEYTNEENKQNLFQIIHTECLLLEVLDQEKQTYY